jgi:hypothetical protein
MAAEIRALRMREIARVGEYYNNYSIGYVLKVPHGRTPSWTVMVRDPPWGTKICNITETPDIPLGCFRPNEGMQGKVLRKFHHAGMGHLVSRLWGSGRIHPWAWLLSLKTILEKHQ